MVARWIPALVLGALWWWAVLRLALVPERAGLVEGAVAVGGWGLSLLPVHVVSFAESGVRRAGSGRGGTGPGARWCGVRRGVRRGVTRAWRSRRSDGGSGPS
ncbi:hypothetical protein [Streptomyces sp. NPDC050504]|uniref:hypothetical protein n=1 Tax=Streptomyces sp. NPDC050504 TaxID=3365618 RepID=UPI00378CC206